MLRVVNQDLARPRSRTHLVHFSRSLHVESFSTLKCLQVATQRMYTQRDLESSHNGFDHCFKAFRKNQSHFEIKNCQALTVPECGQQEVMSGLHFDDVRGAFAVPVRRHSRRARWLVFFVDLFKVIAGSARN